HGSTFIAVEESLSLGKIEDVSSGNIVEIAIAIPIDIFRRGYGTDESSGIAEAIEAAEQFKRTTVEMFHLRRRQEPGLGHFASWRKSSGCSAKTASAARRAAASGA